MTIQAIIVKIGGKILEDKENIQNTIAQLRELLKKNIVQKILIITGGGSLANYIRKIDTTLNIGDDLSHWMAILAMDYNGMILSKKFSYITFINNFKLLQDLIIEKDKRQILIFGPFNYLYEEDILPHSWEVTSDSITLLLANKLELNTCYLIKNIDGILIKSQKLPITEISTKDYIELMKTNKLARFETQTTDLKESQPIDSYVLKLINDFNIPCIILNGKKGKLNILRYFSSEESNEKIFTKIRYD